ncbi:MAG TPA: bifunctional phosphopantothenoylcysteine decarboxylase/phosphopantothenate--cysteine ligase CoaBC, partial [Propionibacteriaceae bacterium]|nr:bifunctional phosphopantothenoylcysteine decarboxylase/phosphopantothenate--cysteine ligase CoaBC [Propionibacteriaceae bacterium]
PAMHTEMWNHPATRANVATLRSRGVHLVGPDDGPLTGGDSGPGRMSEPEAIHEAALALLGARADLAGCIVVVSAGGTREPIDPVRYLGNRSSGRQGVALAVAAAQRGARVLLVAANIDGDILRDAEQPGIDITEVGSTADLSTAMRRAAETSDVIIMAAAVADYRVAEVSASKLTKETGAPPTITLVENEDIVAGLAERRRPGQTIVAFAAETATGDELLERGRRKRRRKGVDLLAVNEVGWQKGFEAADNRLTILGPTDEVVAETDGSKRHVAEALLDAVLDLRGRP